MAKTFTDLTGVFGKSDNQEALDQIISEEVPSDEYLDATQWNKVGKVIKELEDAVNDIEGYAVKGIKQGITTYYPENNIITLPGADSQVGVYLNLETNRIVSVTGKLVVGIRAISTVGGSNTGEVVEIQVMTAAEGSTDWSLGGKFMLNTRGFNSDVFDDIDLTEYVGAGTHSVQLVATGQRTGVTGYSDTFTAVLTSMRLVNQQNYQTAIDTVTYKTFPIAYSVYGTVDKVLHVKIRGSVITEELTYELSAADDSVTIRKSLTDDAAHGYLTHGVREVEAWLTADDGQGNVLESDHLVNRFMVVNRATEGVDLSKPYLLIQNELTKATNFVQTKICDYAVYSPNIDEEGNYTGADGGDVTMVFLVTAYARNYLTEKPEEYFRMEQKVSPNTTNNLNITVEIEPKEGEEEQKTFNSYFRAYRMDSDTLVDMLTDSVGANNIYIEIDNTDSFAPMSGADFVLNPKVRNNTESNPKRILNARKNNAEITSIWENFGFVNDGWVTNLSDNQKVLRIPAGAKLKLAYNPFSQFLTTPNSSMTLDLDFAVRNMTDEDEQIIGINEVIDGRIVGLVIRPITGVLFTASNVVEDESDFRWQEDKRVHISINIHNAVIPDMGDALKPTADTGIDVNATNVALIRVFINGCIEREMKYSITNRNEFITADASVVGGEILNGIVLGSDSADLDIYSIRCYKSMSLETDDVQKNWIASLPTSEEKLAARTENAMKSAGKIDIEKVKALGKRCLIWHGSEPYYYAADAQRGWWEILQYNADGTLNREYSGTIAKETKRLKATRQGSTANTYYYSNLQTKIKDLETELIKVNVLDLHSSIILGEPYEEVDEETKEPTGKLLVDITGGNLGKNYPIESKTAPYEYITEGNNNFVMVPDGWVDGNNKYRGLGFIVTEGTPMAQKVVNKINYASPMQSHLCGCTRAYSDLHTAVVGKNSIQEAYSGARVAKYTEPFYFFVQGSNDPSPVFRGLGTFGGGKADKPTWGYVKKLHPMMMLVEGSDNNYTMTDFRCPWDSKVTYSPEDEGWFRAGLQHWDFDMGATDVFNEGTPDEYEVPKSKLTALWRDAYNFIYMHAPMLMYYAGTFNAFKESKEAENTTVRYWCTEGADAFKLKRYDDVSLMWVDAGLETAVEGEYEVIDLRTHKFTAAAYAASTNKSDFDKLNSEFIAAIVADYKKYLGWYFKPASVRFHYCFINHLMAGTDNCSKNTYYVSDPKAVNVTIDGVTKECYLFEMHQDDVDTIGPTDNNGRSTKPYYIDRMHPFSDKDLKTSCYEGNNSAFFNLCELAFEGTLELQSTMKRIFDAMSDIMASNTETLLDFDGSATNTVWGFFHKYFFNIQRYFSNTAFNEAARIRYEYPAMINYTSRGPGARGIAPITQSVGGQIQSEIQYYRRRLVLMASYAAWGDFYDGGKTHKIGISEAADSFPLQAYHLPDSATSNTEYKFTVRPHQYIYPTGVMGQTAVDPHVRLKPDQEYVMSLGTTTSNDTGMSLLGINYYKSIGNIGDLSVSPNITVTINGKRLVEFIAEPTKLYEDMETHEMVPAFRPGSINVTSTRLNRFSLNGCKQIGGTLNASSLVRVEEIDVRNTDINNVVFPQSTSLKRIYLGKIRSINLSDMPNLQTFLLSDYSALTSFVIGEGVPALDSYAIVLGAQDANAPLSTISVQNVNWKECNVKVIEWIMTIPSLKISGNIEIFETSPLSPAVTYDIKKRINETFGNVDDANSTEHKGVLIKYAQRDFTSGIISGLFYVDEENIYNGRYPMSMKPANNYVNTFTKIEWLITPPTKGSEWSIDSKTGVITVSKLSDNADRATVTCKVTKFYDGTYSIYTLTKVLEIYNRKVQLGDYVYADGTYSNQLDDTKTVVGVCFFIAPGLNEGQVDPMFMNPNDKQLRFMVALKDITYIDQNNNIRNCMPWGCTKRDGQHGMYYTDSSGKIQYFDGVEQGFANGKFYDIEDMRLRSTELIYISDSSWRDTTSDIGIKNNGFALFRSEDTRGAGMAYQESAVYLQERTLTKELAELTDGQYKEGDIVNVGYSDTLRVIKHRNAILDAGLSHPNGGTIFPSLPKPSAKANVSELDDLFNCCWSLISFMQSKGAANSTVWAQSYYPAVSAAYAYEPYELKQGEKLNTKFVKRNWFLPPYTLLVRLLWYDCVASPSDNIFRKSIEEGVNTTFTKSYTSSWWFGGGVSSHISYPTAHCGNDGQNIILGNRDGSQYRLYNYTRSYPMCVRPICAF